MIYPFWLFGLRLFLLLHNPRLVESILYFMETGLPRFSFFREFSPHLGERGVLGVAVGVVPGLATGTAPRPHRWLRQA